MLEIRTVDDDEIVDCRLEYCDATGATYNHLHCDSLEEAFDQAEREFSVPVEDWEVANELVEYTYEQDEKQAQFLAGLVEALKGKYGEASLEADPSIPQGPSIPQDDTVAQDDKS